MDGLKVVVACIAGGVVAAIPLPGSFGGAYLVTETLFPECSAHPALEWTFTLCALTGKVALIALLISLVVMGALTGPFAIGLTAGLVAILALNLSFFALDLCTCTSTQRASARAAPLQRL